MHDTVLGTGACWDTAFIELGRTSFSEGLQSWVYSPNLLLEYWSNHCPLDPQGSRRGSSILMEKPWNPTIRGANWVLFASGSPLMSPAPRTLLGKYCRINEQKNECVCNFPPAPCNVSGTSRHSINHKSVKWSMQCPQSLFFLVNKICLVILQ